MSLKTKMILAVSLLVAVLTAAGSYLSFSYFKRHLKQTISSDQVTLTADIAAALQDKVATAQDLLAHIAREIGPSSHNVAVLGRLLEQEEHARSFFDNGIGFISVSGKLLAKSPLLPGEEGKDFSKHEFFRETMAAGKPIVSVPYQSPGKERHPVLIFTCPVVDRDGRITGLLAGSYDLAETNFLSRLGNIKVGRTGTVQVVDRRGVIIMHTDRAKILSKFPFHLKEHDPEAETVASVVRQPEGQVLFTRHDIRGVPWTVAVTYPLKDAYAALSKAEWYGFLVMLGMVAFSILVVWLVMNRITAPLLLFTKHVSELPDHEGSRKLFQIRTGDEIQTLAETFNGMVQELDRQKEDLQKNSELYRMVALFTAQFAYLRAVDGSIQYISPNCELMTGYDDTDFFAYPDLLDRIVHPDDAERWQRHVAVASERWNGAPIDFRIITRDGQTKWMSSICRPIYDDSGRPTAIRGNISDITARKHAEEAVRESKLTLEGIIGAVPFALICLDSELRVSLWNSAAEKIFGWRAEEVMGRRYPLVPLDDTAAWRQLHDVAREGTVIQGEAVKRIHKNGTAVEVVLFSGPVRGSDGSIRGVAVALGDVAAWMRKPADDGAPAGLGSGNGSDGRRQTA